MKTYSVISDYLLQIRQFSHDGDELLGFIDKKLESVEKDSFYSDFFRGERAFYSGCYALALKYYLRAPQDFAHFHFFCYRASALVFEKRGENRKALAFAKKALHFFPDDLSIQDLFQRLEENSESPSANSLDYAPRIALGGKEWDELTHIFDSQNQNKF